MISNSLPYTAHTVPKIIKGKCSLNEPLSQRSARPFPAGGVMPEAVKHRPPELLRASLVSCSHSARWHELSLGSA